MKTKSKKVTIKLSEAQAELLLFFLEEASDNRSNMGCNDGDENELKKLSFKELKELLVVGGKEHANYIYTDWLKEKKENNISGTYEDYLRAGHGFMNMMSVDYIMDVIEKQLKK